MYQLENQVVIDISDKSCTTYFITWHIVVKKFSNISEMVRIVDQTFRKFWNILPSGYQKNTENTEQITEKR